MTVVKICGITNLADARLAAGAGTDLIGFIFYPPSPRNVSEEQVREIVRGIRSGAGVSGSDAQFVGVFVDQPVQEVARIMDFCSLDYAQLHGKESPQESAALTGMGYCAIKAFRVRDAASLARIGDYQAAAYLLDTYVPGAAGGTGRRFDWTLALEAQSQGPIILAGGLNPDNVGEGVRTVRPWGVDVSSGVEAQPGRKDPEKVRRFIIEAKTAGAVNG